MKDADGVPSTLARRRLGRTGLSVSVLGYGGWGIGGGLRGEPQVGQRVLDRQAADLVDHAPDLHGGHPDVPGLGQRLGVGQVLGFVLSHGETSGRPSRDP